MGNEESSISEGQMQVWVGKAGGLCCFVFHYGDWLVFIMPRTMEVSPGAKLAELQRGEVSYQDLWVNCLS